MAAPTFHIPEIAAYLFDQMISVDKDQVLGRRGDQEGFEEDIARYPKDGRVRDLAFKLRIGIRINAIGRTLRQSETITMLHSDLQIALRLKDLVQDTEKLMPGHQVSARFLEAQVAQRVLLPCTQGGIMVPQQTQGRYARLTFGFLGTPHRIPAMITPKGRRPRSVQSLASWRQSSRTGQLVRQTCNANPF